MLPLLLHGDAAFAGQGIVAETMSFDRPILKATATGGTIHFIVNNQIGFTTAPSLLALGRLLLGHRQGPRAGADLPRQRRRSRSRGACRRIAVEFRQRFKRDVVIDMFCYRRHGHNEADEPSFTQPLMYKTQDRLGSRRRARSMPSILIAEGGMAARRRKNRSGSTTISLAHLESQFEAAKNYKPNKADWLEGKWAGIELAKEEDNRGDTGVRCETLLRSRPRASAACPRGTIHRTIRRQLDNKKKLFEAGEGDRLGDGGSASLSARSRSKARRCACPARIAARHVSPSAIRY